MRLTKRHLHIYDLYEGKKSSLEKVGTKEEKDLFQNGEFEKISELLYTEYRIKMKQATELEAREHKLALDSTFDSNWNKRSLRYLSKKYCAPEKKENLFSSIMSMLWAMFG